MSGEEIAATIYGVGAAASLVFCGYAHQKANAVRGDKNATCDAAGTIAFAALWPLWALLALGMTLADYAGWRE